MNDNQDTFETVFKVWLYFTSQLVNFIICSFIKNVFLQYQNRRFFFLFWSTFSYPILICRAKPSDVRILFEYWVSINLHIYIERFRFCMSAIRVNYFSCYIICGMWHAELRKIYINWKFIWFCAATVSIIWQTFDWLLIISTDQILLKRLFMNMHKI